MIIKKLCRFLFCIYIFFQLSPIVCMMEEEQPQEVNLQPEKIALQELSENNVEKVFVCNTNDQHVKIVLVQTAIGLDCYRVKKEENNQAVVTCLTNKNNIFDIQCCASSATFSESDQSYTIYFTSKEKQFFSTKYVVQEWAIFLERKTNTLQSLFEHNSCVMQLDFLGDTKKYLVTGSIYPSIKIYDFEAKKVIKTLHNRFLLGCLDDKLLYARKEENERRQTGLTRWLYSDSKKEYPSTICTLKGLEKKTELQKDNFLINISPDQYPLVTTYQAKDKNALVIFDTKENELITYYNDNLDGASVSLLNIALTNKEKIEIQNYVSFLKYLEELFKNETFLEYIKSKIILENFESFLLQGTKITCINYLKHMFQSAILEFIENEQIAEIIANQMVKNVDNELYRTERKPLYDFQLYEFSQYKSLRKCINTTAFRFIDSGLDGQMRNINNYSSINFYMPVFGEKRKVEKIYADQNYITMQMTNEIAQKSIHFQNSNFFKLLNLNMADVCNIFTIDSMLYMVKKDGLYSIDLQSRHTSQEKIIRKEQEKKSKIRVQIETEHKETQAKRLQDEQSVKEQKNKITNFISTLTSEQSISKLKDLFANHNQFIVNNLNDLVVGERLEGSVTDLVQKCYLKPILNEWIENFTKNDFGELEKKNLIATLEKTINNLTTWFTNVFVTPIFSLNDYQDTLNINNQNTVTSALQRFNFLSTDIEQLKKTDENSYTNKMRGLIFLNALENKVLNTETDKDGRSIKNQTYIKYFQSKCIEKCTTIKDISLNVNELAHNIFKQS